MKKALETASSYCSNGVPHKTLRSAQKLVKILSNKEHEKVISQKMFLKLYSFDYSFSINKGDLMRSKPDVKGLKSILPSGLYLVATPIGNLLDLSLRAVETLQNVDVIACEDTRVTSKILTRHGIKTKMDTYHEHNASRIRPKLLRTIENGGSIALVSDAGTPTISDPGYKLVKKCIEFGFDITTTPGANAAITGLVLSGLPTNRFLFAGFLNSKANQRRKELEELANVPTTLIFYESAKRLIATLKDMVEKLGNRPAAVARELTKRHEEIQRNTLSALTAHYLNAGTPKGEIVIVVGPPLKKEPPSSSELDDLIKRQLQTLSVRDTAAKITLETGLPKRQIYKQTLKLFKI
jgi:16S rRNA (cytidine1402-2'-O)-methyltransferase